MTVDVTSLTDARFSGRVFPPQPLAATTVFAASEQAQAATPLCVGGDREAAMVLRAACAARTPAVWQDSDGRQGTGTLVQVASDCRVDSDAEPISSGSLLLEFVAYGLWISLHCNQSQNGVIGPFRLFSTERRVSTRIRPSELLEIEWFSNGAEGLQANRAQLLDISGTGAKSMFPWGTSVPESNKFAATIWAGAEFVHCMAEIRSRNETPSGLAVGLRLVTAEPGALSHIVLRAMFPHVKPRREVPLEQLLRLFDESGYMKLRESCASPETAGWLTMNADELTRDVVYVSNDGEALGHTSATRGYRNTWIAHQTAMRSNHPEAADARQVLRNMTLTVSLMDGQQGRTVAYYDRTKAYGRMFFDRFVEAVADQKLAMIADLDWFERDINQVVDPLVIAEYSNVGLAHANELAAVTELARSYLPGLIADAMDLHPAYLRSAALHPLYRGSDFTRTREVLVARSGDRIVGAALCEHTSSEFNLSNTLNVAHIFFVKSDVDYRLKLALVDEVDRYYRARAVSDPMLVAPPGLFDRLAQTPLRFSKHVGLIAWSFDGLRAYDNYLVLKCNWLEHRGRRKTAARHQEG